MSNDTKFAKRGELDELHGKVDSVAEDVSFIKGKIEGMAQQQKSDWTSLGIIGAIIMGLYNMLFK